jgi:hypothetical protein
MLHSNSALKHKVMGKYKLLDFLEKKKKKKKKSLLVPCCTLR